MKKQKNPAGRPAPAKLFCVLMLGSFLLALFAGIRFFGGENAKAALSDSSMEAEVFDGLEEANTSTETDAETDAKAGTETGAEADAKTDPETGAGNKAEKTFNAVLSPADIAEMDTDFAMSSYVNYTAVTEALVSSVAESGSNSIFSGAILSIGSYANEVLLTALETEEPSGESEKETDTTTQNWFYYIYYVGQDDSYDITKTGDFSLKYQMEFRTSEDLDAGTVEIRIPAVLLTYRSESGGTAILPDDIAIPAGSPEEGCTYSSKTPMNYCYETDGNGEVWLVFWNYRDITSGTDMAWQILYRDLDAMSITDMTTWELDSYASVNVCRSGSYYEQTNTGHTLTGLVNTSTKLASLTKGACSISGKSYAPCLYTKKQVDRFISYQTEDYADVMDCFDDYVYVVWTVTAKVAGNQPFTLEMLDETVSDDGTNGFVIGYSVSMTETGASEAGYQVLTTGNISGSYTASFYVVTAYPGTVVTAGTMVINTITAKLIPYDEIDEVQIKTASAEVAYREYEWDYDGELFRSDKTSNQTYEAYAEAYKYYYANGMDFGTFPFTTSVFARGYGLTHSIVWPGAGSYITGTYYIITLEDSTMDLNGTELTCEDYYFSSVAVTRTDHGYDIYEDETTTTLDATGMNQDVTIYAMFADNPDVWEEAGTIFYDENGGTKTCEFNDAQIAREPYAVKAVYNATNYDTSCNIAVNTVIKTGSETMRKLVGESTTNIILTDTSTATVSVAGGAYTYQNVYEKTMSACKTFTRLNGANEAEKTVTTTNDAVNERVQLTYSMAAYDGYKVYDAQTSVILEELDVLSPSRNMVVFYDLLPYGVHYDASVTPTAGRLTGLETSAVDSIASISKWSTAQTEITEVEITENWEGTGRTMVAFHLSYSGADSATVSSDYVYGTLWYSGWGISFKAYYDWKDIDIAAADGNKNIFAYMPESDAAVGSTGYKNDMRAFLGGAYADDGGIASVDTDYTDFAVADLNGDGDTTTTNVLYGKCLQSVNIALASRDYITKLVRADANVSAAYAKTASVGENRGYTYDITVTTIKGLTKLVIFDRLEYGLEDHTADEEEFFCGETESWKGTLVSVDLTGAKLAGADDITIWYNASPDAAIPGEFEEASDYLTAAYGWYTADDWMNLGLSEEDVGAFAVDFGDFRLEMTESVSFQVHMLAPAAGEVAPDVTYAFNNSWFSSYSVSTGTYGTVQGNTVRVSLGEVYELTVEKEFEGDVPSSFENTEFEFHLTLREQNQDFSQRIYTLWEKDENGDWQQITETCATDYNGYLYLNAGQKAVFEDVTSAEMQELQIAETESVYWDSGLTVTTDDSTDITKVTYVFANTCRAPLYVSKLTTAVPDDVDVTEYEFEVTITFYNEKSGEWEPYADSVYWIVKAARTNGTEPTKLSEGCSGPDGTITICAGQVIAVFLPPGTQYRAEETGTGTDFFVQTGTFSGETALSGTAVNINNIYRWKDLELTKLITYQDASECTREFTFQILHVLEDETTEILTTENAWYVTDANGSITDSGTLTVNGEFTAACAGCTVTIRGLEAGETYLVKETDSGELYEDVTGSVSVTMPLYSTSKSAKYTNKWLMRDLSVSKYVAGDTTGASDGVEFVFALYVNGKAAEGYAYQVTENGTTGDRVYYTEIDGFFLLENGQTAVFSDCGLLGETFEVYEIDDAGFTRVYPSDDSALTGTFEEDGSQVTFVNGDSGSLMVAKTYTSDNSAAAAAYVSLIRSDTDTRESAAVTFTMEVTTDGVTYTSWPTASVTVEVIDTLSGTSSTKTWTTGGITIEPWMYIVITSDQLDGAAGYRITESAADRCRIVQDEEGNYLSVTQSYPADDAAYSGEIETSPVAAIINKVTDVTPKGSAVYKRMAAGSEEPSVGAELVLTLQQYNGSSWVAAGGVAYLTFDGEGLTCDRVLCTDSDGSITLTKTENGYPYIWFLNAEVFLNLYDMSSVTAGTYRILENTDATENDEWGILVGYGTVDSAYGYSLDETEAVAFVNANRTARLKVEKVTGAESSQSFTFTLSHVLSTDEDGNILANEAGAYISYLICDAETDEPVSGGMTDASGRFTLTGGQYAVFELEDGAVWTVTETIDPKWTLSNLTAETNENISGWMAEVISENTAEVRTLAETVYAIKAETTYTEVEAETTLSKEEFTVTVCSSDGTSWPITSDEFEISPGTAQTKAGKMEVAVTYKDMEDTVALTVVAEEYDVSYAVAIYGIQTDTYTDENGDTQFMGLTMGPASGKNYISTYDSHVDTDTDGTLDLENVVTSANFKARTAEKAEEEGVTYCIHWLTWSQIVEQSKVDPTVFQDCLTSGCTHAVHINLNNTLASNNGDYSGMQGDGASSLLYTISSDYRRWNSSNTTNGGWSSSKIRTTLNNTSYGLITCFPQVLQENIMSREISSPSSYSSSYVPENWTTTSDRLWLFSYKEYFGYNKLNTDLHYEGKQYMRMQTYATTAAKRYLYNEKGSSGGLAWIRSLVSAKNVYLVNWDGAALAKGYGASSSNGEIAPCFCLPGPTVEGGVEEYNISYAVAIYGIQTDIYLDDQGQEQTAGLTFGAATSADYTETYRSHVDTEADGIDADDLNALNGKTLITSENFVAMTKTDADAVGYVYCIHWLTWDQIVSQCATDPTVFEDCLTYGCTHSVRLNLNNTLWTGTYYKDMEGDGTSALTGWSINSSWTKYNYADTTSGGWPASRIRATLNGAEDGVTVATADVAGTDVLNAEECLFSCFPSVLQDNIVAKAVKSNTVYNSSSESDVVTTYDKLWLFSCREFFGTSNYNLKYEGIQYARMTTFAWWPDVRRHFDEIGVASYVLLRSASTANLANVYNVTYDGGSVSIYSASKAIGFSPGFCLP